MKRLTTVAVLLVLALAAAPAGAVVGTPDNVPAATLLLPYFEVDLSETYEGPVTIFSISNASASAVLAHVTLWTDRGVPTRAFDMYLTGYDMEWVDLRLLFNGIPPQTADDGTDPQDVISNQGIYSQDINYPGAPPPCGELHTRWSEAEVAALRAAHTGQPSALLGGSCAAFDHGDGIARGFVTVDTINGCTTLLPTDPVYFTAYATAQNVLFGQWWTVDRAQNYAYGDALTAIEASLTDPATDSAGDYTFYGRLPNVNGSAADHREALPTTWMSRFVNGGAFDQGTAALVWRDAWPASTFACGAPPAGLDQAQVTVFDEEENVSSPGAASFFPLATALVDLADPGQIPIVPSFGHAYYNLQRTNPVAPFGVITQAHVTHVLRAFGRFAGAAPAWAMDTVRQPAGTLDVPECSNGVDDDGDGLTDYPDDPGCAGPSGGESPQCSNGIDDDGDGLVDFPDDPGCIAAWDGSEFNP